MKKYILALLILASCSKEIDPPCARVVQYVDLYDKNWKFVKSYVAKDFGTICQPDLESWKKLSKRPDTLCIFQNKLIRTKLFY